VFIAGLGLIPLGMWLLVRRERRAGVPLAQVSPLALARTELRHLLVFVGITTAVNLILGSLFTYQAVDYMDSVTFCGKTCHTVMQPEYAAYQNSPHSRVDCVACHIGPGASWFVQSKLSGVGQVFAVTFNTYPRPIPTPVRKLRPARETCEACHWPQKFSEDRLRVIYNYADDEKNSLTKTALMMRIGGGHGSPGIHGAHLGPGVVIHYSPDDESRQSIARVEYQNGLTGRHNVFLAPNVKPEKLAKLATRQMDCMDCHNRPTHTLELPERAVNKALASGAISPSLPFVKKTAVELLRKPYASQEQAARDIPPPCGNSIRARSRRPRSPGPPWRWSPSIAATSSPDEGDLGSYPNNVGHTDFPGCFRCHDDNHATAGGEKIVQDCNTCHQLLAMDEAAPKILTDLGLQ